MPVFQLSGIHSVNIIPGILLLSDQNDTNSLGIYLIIQNDHNYLNFYIQNKS